MVSPMPYGVRFDEAIGLDLSFPFFDTVSLVMMATRLPPGLKRQGSNNNFPAVVHFTTFTFS